MNKTKIKNILYIIILITVAATALQVYWNYNSFLNNKQQLKNDIQLSLDASVNNYFENLAKKNTLGFKIDSSKQASFFKEKGTFESLFKEIDITKNGVHLKKDFNSNDLNGISIISNKTLKEIKSKTANFNVSDPQGKKEWKAFIDSLKNQKKEKDSPLEFLTSKIIISISNEDLNLKEIDSFLTTALNSKNISIKYGLQLKQNDSIVKQINASNIYKSTKPIKTNSLLIDDNESIELFLENETHVILQRIIGEIILSIILICALAACLFYMLKIINKQKQLAEIKNDLISNITHEFKTPITTIGIALESIKDFNKNQLDEKSNKYLDLSSNQLSKLTIMVEKLLETATLDSGNLILNKTKANLNSIIKNSIDRHQIQTELKTLSFSSNKEEVLATIDKFHFENAINNLIDNAAKYGGDTIDISIISNPKATTITILDNGTSLTKVQSQQIFDKFYRVPKGNVHDVKGFGIGLYYTKTIIEKHNGQISVTVKPYTNFKITLPNDN